MRREGVAFLLAGTVLACRRPAPSPDCLTIDAPAAPVGFDAAVTIRARSACAGTDLSAGTITWRQVGGPALRDLATEPGDGSLRARTAALAEVMPGPLPWGVVPFSARTAGPITLEAVWTDGRGRALRRQVRFALAPRSRGLPNIPLGTRAYLGGAGWRLTSRPATSRAALETAGGVTSFVPDVAGDYVAADGAGTPLVLRSARYDDTPLDCGRAGCHAAITGVSAASPMTTVLARGLARVNGDAAPAFGPAYPGCALACHTTGEPGLMDGGYAHVAGELGVPAGLASPWEQLPRPMRRLGGVGCMACHGPAALPPPEARWAVLRSDVCAVCHDAPPRYGHVVAWQRTAMARADRDARARGDRACAACHTTWGFLASLGNAARRPPVSAAPFGIGCAACHGVHDTARAGAPAGALLRVPRTPALLAGAAPAPAVCLPCHTTDPNGVVPSATAAALWLGRGGIDPASGGPLNGPAPHAAVAGGCVGCHAGVTTPGVHGGGHTFAAAAATCTPCHPQAPARPEVTSRARRLWDAWRAAAGTPAADSGPAHAGNVRPDRRTPFGRAGWDVLMVLEDPAAAVHNARYAGALLDAATPVIETARRKSARRATP